MISYFADIEGHSGVEIYSRELYNSLAVDTELVKPTSLLSPNLLNQVFLNSLKLRKASSETIHITNQDDFAALSLPEDKNYIVTVHDIFPYVEDFSGPFYSWLSERYVANLENYADRIIAISEATKEQLIDNTEIREERIEVIYEGVDLETFRPEEVETGYEEYYLHVGSEINRKNVPGLIEIFARIKEKRPETKLVRVGEPSSKTRKVIEEHGLELGKDVVYESEISTERLVALYSNAEKLLFPSFGEGFGRPMLESLACGTPVVAYDRKPMSELLPDKMLVEFEEKDSFVEKALDTGKDRDCRKIAETFTWEKTAEKTRNIYKEFQ